MPLPSQMSPEFIPRDMMPKDLREEVAGQEKSPKRPSVVSPAKALEAREIESGLIKRIEQGRERVILELAENFADFFGELPEGVQTQILHELARLSEGDPKKRLNFANELALKILEELDRAELAAEQGSERQEVLASSNPNRQVSSRLGKIRLHGKPHNTPYVGQDSEGRADRDRSRMRSSRRNYGRKPQYKDTHIH